MKRQTAAASRTNTIRGPAARKCLPDVPRDATRGPKRHLFHGLGGPGAWGPERALVARVAPTNPPATSSALRAEGTPTPATRTQHTPPARSDRALLRCSLITSCSTQHTGIRISYYRVVPPHFSSSARPLQPLGFQRPPTPSALCGDRRASSERCASRPHRAGASRPPRAPAAIGQQLVGEFSVTTRGSNPHHVIALCRACTSSPGRELRSLLPRAHRPARTSRYRRRSRYSSSAAPLSGCGRANLRT